MDVLASMLVLNTKRCKMACPAFFFFSFTLAGLPPPTYITSLKKTSMTPVLKPWNKLKVIIVKLQRRWREEKIETISEMTSDVWVAATSSPFVLRLFRPCQTHTTRGAVIFLSAVAVLWLYVALCCPLISYDRTLEWVCARVCNQLKNGADRGGWQPYPPFCSDPLFPNKTRFFFSAQMGITCRLNVSHVFVETQLFASRREPVASHAAHEWDQLCVIMYGSEPLDLQCAP